MTASTVLTVSVAPAMATEPLTDCKLGQYVAYGRGNIGEIVGEHGGSCLVRPADGRLQSWIAVGGLSPTEPPKAASVQRGSATEATQAEASAILRRISAAFGFPAR
jgi:hypothetical protein